MAVEIGIHILHILFRQLGPYILALQLIALGKSLFPLRLGFANGAQFYCCAAIHVAGAAILAEKVLPLACIAFPSCHAKPYESN